MNKKLILSIALVGATIVAGSTFAYNSTNSTNYGYQWTNTASETFVDANGDGVCDSYVNRNMDGTGKWKLNKASTSKWQWQGRNRTTK